ncbi:Protein of unknown function [Actinopolymorpha singaporensis]|uniref:DinB superfamily protein n=1 Tax=Actinopolymorpha singaporensis TaxID=117157 RepID=A0A1H1LUW8_9ACTN|nr:Protein of unknown function [Actinopolymorpha singaporensis]
MARVWLVSEPSEPDYALTDPRDLLAGFLDYYRDVVIRKLDGLSEQELRTSRLPSGWTPLQLLKHLTNVERRWLVWGFLAEPVADPWADDGPDGRWLVRPEESVDDVLSAFHAQAARSREIVAGGALSDLSALGGRFPADVDAQPSLGWILFHVLQEYARHAGHLDVARELADGAVGE